MLESYRLDKAHCARPQAATTRPYIILGPPVECRMTRVEVSPPHAHTHTHTHPHTPTHTPTHTHTHTRPKALSIPETSLIATVFTISVYTAVHVIISF